MSASGGNLLATAGGVWGTTGSGMSEWVWFAPGGNAWELNIYAVDEQNAILSDNNGTPF